MNKKEIGQGLADLRYLNTWIPKIFENELGISLIRYEVMSKLLKYESMNQNDIQKILDIDRAAITRHLQILEEKGYITREKNPLDNRGIIVIITPLGHDTMMGCTGDHELMINKIINGISEQQLLEFSCILQKFKENVESILKE